VPAGTYDLTATAPGHAPQGVSGVVAADFDTVVTDFDLAPYVFPLADDVESGNLGWTAEAPWAITTEAAASPIHSWTDSPGGPYAFLRNVSLTSPSFDLQGLTAVTLSFRQLYDLEQGYDFGRVEVSADGGTSWSPVATYSGTQTASWALVELAVPALDGAAAARVRFRLTSDAIINADGWHLDDVALRAVATGPGPEIFADGFESGDTSAWSAVVP
jgi:hypothetical protein